VEFRHIRWDRTKWVPVPDGLPFGIIVWLLNEPATDEPLNEVRSVVTTVTYRENDLTLGHVDRAYWLSESANEIAIGIGERKGILIGAVAIGPTWMAYNNPRRSAWRMPRNINSSPNFREPEKVPILFSEHLDIRGSVISLASGRTVAEFSVTVADHGVGQRTITARQLP
jgi:hypothetical protein